MSTRRERFLPLRNARVAWLDCNALRADFPQLHSPGLSRRFPDLTHLGPAERARREQRILADWVLRRAAWLSVSQTEPNDVNTSPSVDRGVMVEGRRPPGYGRAAIFGLEAARRTWPADEAQLWADEGAGWLDVKGIGIGPDCSPKRDVHGDGLFPLFQVFRELLYQQLIARIIAVAGLPLGVLPAYAAIDAGFLCWDRRVDTLSMPAGLLVRRAHRRCPSELPARYSRRQRVQVEIEMALRQFGLTSASPSSRLTRSGPSVHLGSLKVPGYRAEQIAAFCTATGVDAYGIDVINLQTVAEPPAGIDGVLVDFGQFYVADKFRRPLVSLVVDRPFGWGGVVYPDDPRFVQPDPRLALGTREWGRSRLPDEEARALGLPLGTDLLGPERIGLRLAAAFRTGRAGIADLCRAIDRYVHSTTRHLTRFALPRKGATT